MEDSSIIVDDKRLLKLLQDIIQINSVNPNLDPNGNGELELAEYLGKYMKNLGLEVIYQKLGDKRSNVIGILKGNGNGKSLILNGHMDTVSLEAMSNPLSGKFENGLVYGRGAIDMKSGVASIISAIETLVKSSVNLAGDVIVTAVCDEEYASIGTEEILKEFTADAAIITEPTDLRICIAHKGFTWTRITVVGRASHGSLPEEGIDAITKMGKVLSGLDDLQKNKFPLKTHPILGSPSIHASLIKGGLGLSTYPDLCELQIERRLLPEETKEEVEIETKQLLDSIREIDLDFKADYELFFYRPGLEISEKSPIVVALNQAYESIIGEPSELIGVNYWMDSALFAEAGIPCIVFGPKGKGLHAAVEYVEFDSLVTTTNILVKTIIEFCK